MTENKFEEALSLAGLALASFQAEKIPPTVAFVASRAMYNLMHRIMINNAVDPKDLTSLTEEIDKNMWTLLEEPKEDKPQILDALGYQANE